MTDHRPNILLIMTDQQRGDALSCEGHPVLQTPNIDMIGGAGTRFSHGYSACPQCIPARRTLMSGRTPHGHGVYCNHDTIMHGPTLPGELAAAGYQTHLCGKLHLFPKRKLYGFMSADWADAPHQGGVDTGDYGIWLREHGFAMTEPGMGHGCWPNGWTARPFHLEERFHFTNWCTDMALRFLERRDPTAPFFLKVSYHQPHQPCTPPQCYWDRYIDDPDLPMPVIGDWVDEQAYQPGLNTSSWKTALSGKLMRQWRAGYFGCINHIDDQIARLLRHAPRNTVVIFTSDHGEMLGDHQWTRKTRGLEPSARIPFIMQVPNNLGGKTGQVRDEPVELMDIMPTCLELAGAPIPEQVEGRSLLPLLRGEAVDDWRDHVHGECAMLGGEGGGTQWVTDGRRKFIWDPAMHRQLFFDLEEDPSECRNLIDASDRQSEIATWRERLVDHLANRPEGFVQDGQLNDDCQARRCTPELQEYRDSCGFRPGL